jgi:hypothetical protein
MRRRRTIPIGRRTFSDRGLDVISKTNLACSVCAMFAVACVAWSVPAPAASNGNVAQAPTATFTEAPPALRAAIDRTLAKDADASDRPLAFAPAWLEQEVSATGGSGGDNFGYSVALSGSTAVVGAMMATVGSTDAQGAAYVFVESGGIWTEQQRLVAADGQMYDGFGKTVAVDGDFALVGAQNVNVDGHPWQGAVYVFTRSGDTWTQTQKLTASDGTSNADFGGAMAMKGGVAVVGAYNATVGDATQQGEAYVFTEAAGTWTEAQQLVAPDGVSSDQFGHSIAFDGTTLLIGAWNITIDGNQSQGAAYVFGNAGGSWSETQKLVASDGAANDEFSVSVAVANDTALIGTPYATIGGNQDQGAVYAFTQVGGTWSQVQKIVASDGQAYDGYGWFASTDGSNALIGAMYATVAGNGNQGAAYVLARSNDAWSETNKLTASDGAANSFFGSAGVLAGSLALVGAEDASVGANLLQGAAYFYTQAADDTIFADGFDGSP